MRARLLGLVILLAGCSSVTQSVSRAPSVATELPSAARPSDDAGAVAFVRFCLEQIDNGYQAGDASAVRRWAAPDCQACTEIASSIDCDVKDGRTVTGSRFAEVELSGDAGLTGFAVVTATVDSSAVLERDRGGDVTSRPPKQTGRLVRLTAVRQDDAWRMQEVFFAGEDGPSW